MAIVLNGQSPVSGNPSSCGIFSGCRLQSIHLAHTICESYSERA